VEFYAPWCPHCQHFAPTYGDLATQYKNASSVNFFAVNCEDHGDVCTANNVTGYPTIKAFVKHTSSKYGGDLTLGNLTSWIESSMTDNGIELPTIEKVAPAPAWQHEKKTILSPSPVRRMDLAAAVFNGLEQMVGQVANGGTMSEMKTQALINWLQRLSTVPGLAAPLHPMISAASDGLATKVKGISKAALTSTLNSLTFWGFAYGKKSITLRGDNQEWSACAGPGHGYPCGLWQLLHTLTVYSNGGKDDAQKVLLDIRQFIENFFPCDQCRSHFLQEMDGEVIRSMNSREDAVMWLWRTHNKVSKRLAPEWGISEDLVVYPPVRACENCRKVSLSASQSWKWSDTKVLHFLEHTFMLKRAPVKGKTTLKTLLGISRA